MLRPAATAFFVLVLVVVAAASCDALAGCQPIAPAGLPSGAPLGPVTLGVSGGAKQATWGRGVDLVDEAIGIWQFGDGDVLKADVVVRGSPGHIYEGYDSPGVIGLVWSEHGCDYTVMLDASITVARMAEYANRF